MPSTARPITRGIASANQRRVDLFASPHVRFRSKDTYGQRAGPVVRRCTHRSRDHRPGQDEFYGRKVHRWRAHYHTPDGKQRNKTFARKVDAERFLTTVESSKLTGTFVDPSRSRVTFGEMAKKLSASKVGLKESTRARYDSALNTHVLPRWKHVPLSGVHHEQIQEWIAELCASGMSGAAVHKVVGVMSGVLELAVRARRLSANPAANVELPHSKSRRKRYLTADQVELMAEAARALPSTRPRLASNASFEQYRLVVYVLAYCGLRWSEVAALRTHSVDLVKGRITVERQSSKSTTSGWYGAHQRVTRHDGCLSRSSF